MPSDTGYEPAQDALRKRAEQAEAERDRAQQQAAAFMDKFGRANAHCVDLEIQRDAAQAVLRKESELAGQLGERVARLLARVRALEKALRRVEWIFYADDTYQGQRCPACATLKMPAGYGRRGNRSDTHEKGCFIAAALSPGGAQETKP